MQLITIGTIAINEDYDELRTRVRVQNEIFRRLPAVVSKNARLDGFWYEIKRQFGTHEERRAYLTREFQPLLDHLATSESSVELLNLSRTLSVLNSDHIANLWEKAHSRRFEDPSGAITAARSMVESTCKTILKDRRCHFDRRDELPDLWRKVAEELDLTPERHGARSIKTVLGNCQSVINGLANLRNDLSDAHGADEDMPRAEPLHAELAINLAGSMVSFLIAVWTSESETTT